MAVSISKNKWSGNAVSESNENTESVVFTPIWSNAAGHQNRLYFGNNLDVLRYLLDDQQVKGHVKLIYIDPPYNTGGIFQTRDLRDAYSDFLSTKEYVHFMRERLEVMHLLLSDDGSIYVHLDSNMVFHIKILMDEIFGQSNFKGMITRKKCKPKNYTRKTFGNISDYILFYTKTDSPVWNRPHDDWTEEKMLKEYPFIEEGTGRRHKRVPIHAPGIRNGATGKPWRGMLPPPGKHWQFTPDKLEEFDAKGEIYWSSNGNPRRKVYFDENKGVPVQDIWLDFLDVNNQNTNGTGYPTEKNPELIKRIVDASSERGDIVLDCFAGSGTTLAVASELGRRWIGVDIGEEAINTILDRFYKGTSPLGDFTTAKELPETQPLLFDYKAVNGKKNGKHHKVISDFTFYAEEENGSQFIEKLERLR